MVCFGYVFIFYHQLSYKGVEKMQDAQNTSEISSFNTICTIIKWGFVVLIVYRIYTIFSNPDFVFWMKLCKSFGNDSITCFIRLISK